MKFVVSSTELLNRLQAIGRVISSRNTLPILDNFLFKLEGNTLEVTASDLETTLITRINLTNVSEEGCIAIPAKHLTEFVSKFPEQPLTFDISTETFSIRINSEIGEYGFQGYDWEDFPQLPTLKQETLSTLRLPADMVLQGIGKTFFASGDDELRPVMNGIFLEMSTENISFVSTNSQILVRYRRKDASAENDGSFNLPKKPAGLLRTVLAKEHGDVSITFDDKNAMFELSDYVLVCRLVEGKYPAYNSVIPVENPNKLIIDRVDFLGSLRRVSMFTNQATNLVRLELRGNQLNILAQDIDFKHAGHETLQCQYDGEEMNIGFKANFLIEMLSNITSTEISVEMSDPNRACLILPVNADLEGEDLLMLVMPLTLGD